MEDPLLIKRTARLVQPLALLPAQLAEGRFAEPGTEAPETTGREAPSVPQAPSSPPTARGGLHYAELLRNVGRKRGEP